MSFDSARAAIEQRMEAEWDSDAPVLYEASGVTPPTSSPFVRIQIREFGGDQITLGIEPVMRWRGAIICNVFVPLHTGTTVGRQLGEKFRKIFERRSFSTIRCKHVTPEFLGDIDGWWQSNYRCYYYRDDRSLLEG